MVWGLRAQTMTTDSLFLFLSGFYQVTLFAGPSAQYIAAAVDNPRMTNPTANGTVEPLKNCPIIMPMNEESRLAKHPITAAPTPAICANGSIAMAF